MNQPNASVLTLLTQCRRLAWSLAALKEGIKIAINTAMIAITTKSSINVKAFVFIVTSPY
jgi:hypothetical protein